jgi:Xaa-Pro dipeptidase
MSTDDPLPLPDDATATAADGPPGEDSIFAEGPLPDLPAVTESYNPLARRRADVDAKQTIVGRVLEELGCEAAILFMPAHVAWFCGGINVRGLIADTERPGIYTTGRGRWLVCANADTQRLFDEELDRLGFQLKEWQWAVGRAVLLGELVAGKKVAADRPFPGIQMLNDRLRPELRPLAASDQERYRALGRVVVHAVEATARTMGRGQTEEEVAGQVAHRLYHRGAEADTISVTADGRGATYRRAGFTDAAANSTCVIQATGTRDGLYVTASRTVCFGRPDEAFRKEHDTACRLSGVYRSLSTPGGSVGSAGEAGRWLTADTPFEYEWRHTPPGYGAGWFAAEELRRAGHEEKFVANQAVVWQARVGSAAVVDTVLVGEAGPVPVTPPEGWPFKRVRMQDRTSDVPDLLVREE